MSRRGPRSGKRFKRRGSFRLPGDSFRFISEATSSVHLSAEEGALEEDDAGEAALEPHGVGIVSSNSVHVIRNDVQPSSEPEMDDGDLLDMLDNDTNWEEAIGVVAANEENSTAPTSELVTDSTRCVDDETLRKLLSGKNLEAISWLMGNKAVTYEMYVDIAAAMNTYLRLLNMNRYPSYGTLIYNIFEMMNSSVFIRRGDVQADVNTRRSGVAQRHTRVALSGESPKANFSIILPSDWARLDYLQYEYFREPLVPRARMPSILNIENTPITQVEARLKSVLVVHELLPDTNGYRTGQQIHEGDEIQLQITGPQDAIALPSTIRWPFVSITVLWESISYVSWSTRKDDSRHRERCTAWSSDM